jgi:hypothetical protein
MSHNASRQIKKILFLLDTEALFHLNLKLKVLAYEMFKISDEAN